MQVRKARSILKLKPSSYRTLLANPPKDISNSLGVRVLCGLYKHKFKDILQFQVNCELPEVWLQT